MSSVLIVDDEPRVREFLVRWLAPAGYDTRDAPDAEPALAAVAASVPDVVLCDVQMPGRDGLWLVEQLRRRFPAVAIVLAAVRRAVEWRQSAPVQTLDGAAAGDPLAEWLNKAKR